MVKTRKIPTLAVCLSHQLICRELGLEVRRLPHPNQGSQRNISLFGSEVRVGFYNSFSTYITEANNPELDVAYDDATGEIYAVKTNGIVGLQFHPESILSIDGAEVLRKSVLSLISKKKATV